MERKVNFEVVTEFERKIAEFFGAPYAVAVDSCTHGIELCLRYKEASIITCPKHTYISIPMLANKLGIQLIWKEGDSFLNKWTNYYSVNGYIVDAAVYWKKNGYKLIGFPGLFLSISFQYQKHLSLGRGGMILCDDKEAAVQLKKMSYDGRLPNIPWREQDVDTMGYHYYMPPETAQLGLDKLQKAIDTEPRQWVYTDWPDLTQMKIFKK